MSTAARAVPLDPSDGLPAIAGSVAKGRGRARRARGAPVPGKKTSRRFLVSDTVYQRLQLRAIKLGVSPGQVVNDVLDRNLPAFEFKQID